MSLTKLSKTSHKHNKEPKEIQTLFTEIQKHPYWSHIVKFQEKVQPKMSKLTVNNTSPNKKLIALKSEEKEPLKKAKKWIVLDTQVQKLLEKKLQNLDTINLFQKDNEEYIAKKEGQQNDLNKQLQSIQLQQQKEEQRQKYENLQTQFKDFNYNYEYMREQFKTKIKSQHFVGYKACESLFPKIYVNDEVLNFFNQFILDNYVLPDKREKLYLFNTYFMTNLCPHEQMEMLDQDYDGKENQNSAVFNLFENRYFGNDKMLTKTKRYIKSDIFEKDYLIFPLFLPEHWSLFIVCFPGKLITQTTPHSQMEIEDDIAHFNTPCILYFDSFGIKDEKYIIMLRLLIEYEYKTRKAADSSQEDKDNFEVNEYNMPCYQPLVPKQTNYCDCGVYMMEYIEQFLQDPFKILDGIEVYIYALTMPPRCTNNAPPQTPFQHEENWNKLDWFPRQLTVEKRDHILQILMSLRNEYPDTKIAVDNYRQSRESIIRDINKNPSQSHAQYDSINMENFSKFLLSEKNEDINTIDPKEKHKRMLDYYMNPNYEHNYYEQ